MDTYNLQRFVEAQDKNNMYEVACTEIVRGKKYEHWIWYVFPQHIALGKSSMNRMYGIASSNEAKAYIDNELLRNRLLNICEALYNVNSIDLESIVGMIDAYKIRSCCTLFKTVAPEYDVFDRIIQKYFRDIPCYRTIGLLERGELRSVE